MEGGYSHAMQMDIIGNISLYEHFDGCSYGTGMCVDWCGKSFMDKYPWIQKCTWDQYCAGCSECSEAGNKPQCVHSDCYKPANAGGGPKGPSWNVVCQWPKGGKCHGCPECGTVCVPPSAPPPVPSLPPPPSTPPPAPMPPPPYSVIKSKYFGDDKVLDIWLKRNNNGNNHMYMYHDAHLQDWQLFYFEDTPPSRIMSPALPGKCLDYVVNHHALMFYDCHDGNNQKWSFKDLPPGGPTDHTMIPHKEKGASRIMSHQNGKCMDIWIGHHGHDQVMMWDCHDGANQKFWMHEP
jgi:hypothetical protein